MKKKKRKLEAAVVKPGWRMAQQMLERGSRHEQELRVWLVREREREIAPEVRDRVEQSTESIAE